MTPVVLYFTQKEKNLIKLCYGSFLQFCTSFGDKASHGNVWIPDDIFINEIRELYQHLGCPTRFNINVLHQLLDDSIQTWKGLLNIAGIPATFSPVFLSSLFNVSNILSSNCSMS